MAKAPQRTYNKWTNTCWFIVAKTFIHVLSRTILNMYVSHRYNWLEPKNTMIHSIWLHKKNGERNMFSYNMNATNPMIVGAWMELRISRSAFSCFVCNEMARLSNKKKSTNRQIEPMWSGHLANVNKCKLLHSLTTTWSTTLE